MHEVIHCTHERHAAAILEILNDTILSSTALFDYEPRPAASMQPWFERKITSGYPVIGLERDGRLLGFATYGAFRDWPAYRYTVETSVYVHRDHRRQGTGRALMSELIRIAWQQELHVLVAGIEASQQGSIALHQALGFEFAGKIREAGFKFGRWLDLCFYQLVR